MYQSFTWVQEQWYWQFGYCKENRKLPPLSEKVDVPNLVRKIPMLKLLRSRERIRVSVDLFREKQLELVCECISNGE